MSLGDIGRSARRDDFGGKALGLALARELGFNVPDTWVLPADAFRAVVRSELPPGHDPSSLIRIIDRPAGLERAARARAMMLDAELDSEIEAALEALFREAGQEAPWGLAVRSSATCEDDQITSMAGLMETSIGVRSAEDLLSAVRCVWASAFQQDALTYLRARKIKNVAVSVVVQPVVVARAAGILLTADPVPAVTATGTQLHADAAGEPHKTDRVVAAGFGLGTGVTAGTVASDTYRVASDGRVIDRRIANKAVRSIVGSGGVEASAVPAADRNRACLTEGVLAELAEIARRLDGEIEGPCEVEFAVPRRGSVRVLQIRPARGRGYPVGGDAETVWSREGLGESLSGVISPLTWSIFEEFSERGFRRSFSALGVKPPKSTRLVGRVHGRFYFNLSSFMGAAAEVPGLDPRMLLELSPREGRELLERIVEQRRSRRSIARLPLTAARLLAEQSRLADEVKRFEREADRLHAWLAEIDLGILPDESLKTTLKQVRDFFEGTAMLTLSCASASLASHLALKSVLARSMPVGAERVAQSLTAGVGDLEIGKPGVALAHVIAITKRDPDARNAFESGQVAALDDVPPGPARRAIQHFLGAYGDRALGESELMTPRWAEDPSFVLGMIHTGLAANLADPESRQTAVRARADRELTAIERRLSYVEMILVRALVARWRRFTRLREQMRGWLTRALTMLRTVALDADRRLRRIDSTLPERAAFFCTFGELLNAVDRGRDDLGPIVKLRIAEFERDRRRSSLPASFVGLPPPADLPPLSGAVLYGVNASHGEVVGPARLVPTTASGGFSIAPGDVVVSATTDVTLASLFLVAGAIVAEIGSPMSHAAILAREYGVPAVVGVHCATQIISDGDLLRVDGSRGLVERLDS